MQRRGAGRGGGGRGTGRCCRCRSYSRLVTTMSFAHSCLTLPLPLAAHLLATVLGALQADGWSGWVTAGAAAAAWSW